MAKSKNWLVTGAWDKINPIWRDRMLVILEDLAGVQGLRFAQLLDKTGRPISEQIGPGGPRQTVEVKFPLGRFARLYSSSFAAFDELGESPPTHMIEDYKDQLLFVGFIADMILIASFEPSTTRGAIVMRMTKRIRHLHSCKKAGSVERYIPDSEDKLSNGALSGVGHLEELAKGLLHAKGPQSLFAGTVTGLPVLHVQRSSDEVDLDRLAAWTAETATLSFKTAGEMAGRKAKRVDLRFDDETVLLLLDNPFVLSITFPPQSGSELSGSREEKLNKLIEALHEELN